MKILLALLLAASTTLAQDAWDPENTHALFVGILEWQDKNLSPFPKENRQDRELEKRLLAAGVPRANVTFLEDREATQEAILRELRAVAQRSGEGTTLILYYAGHGMQEEKDVYLANYDCDTSRKKKTAIGFSDIARILEKQWKGRRLLLLADCCYSGAMATIVKGFEGQRAAACLTSANASNVSTARWTFTESLVAAFGGSGAPDANRDGAISLRELDGFIHDEMRFKEGQLTRAFTTNGFEKDFVLAKVDAAKAPADCPGPWKVGQYVEAEWKKEWYRAQVLEGKEGEWKIHYLGFEDKWDEWVPAKKLRKPAVLDLSGGDKIQVEWKGKWYAATVLKVEEDFALIHYADYGSEWDEWVTAKRIKK